MRVSVVTHEKRAKLVPLAASVDVFFHQLSPATIKNKCVVHLDDAVVKGVGVEGVLDVTLAHDAQVPNHLNNMKQHHSAPSVRQLEHQQLVTKNILKTIKFSQQEHRSVGLYRTSCCCIPNVNFTQH